MPDLSDGVNWSEIDANNNNAPPNGWPEGMMPSGVNDAARADRGAMKRFWDKINPVQLITPSGGIWTFTTANPAYPTSYVNGEIYSFRPAVASVGGDQFQVNSLGPKGIAKRAAPGLLQIAAILAQDIQPNDPVQVVYNSTIFAGVGGFVLVNPYVPISGDGAGGVTVPGYLTTSGPIDIGSGGLSVNGDIRIGVPGPTHPDPTISYITRHQQPAGYRRIGFTASDPGSVYYPLEELWINASTTTMLGTASAFGYHSRSGINGPYQVNAWNIQWTGGQAHLWIDNVDTGPIVTGSAGSVVIGGNVSAGSVTASGSITGGSLSTTGSITGANLSTTGDITAGGNLHQNGNYHYFAGSSGVVNGNGGPLIYGDANAIVLKPGNGTIGFEVQNYAGSNIFVVNNSGNTTVAGTLSVTGNTTLSGTLSVSGNTTLSSAVNIVAGGLTVGGGSPITATGTLSVSGDILGAGILRTTSTGPSSGGVSVYATAGAIRSDVSGTALYLPSGNVVCQAITAAGTISATGNLSTASTLSATGNCLVGGSLYMGGTSIATLSLGGNYVHLNAGDSEAALQACFIIGSAVDPTNYSRNGSHKFDDRTGATTYAIFNGTPPYAYKPGGGTWGASSDVRLKHEIEDYTSGLPEIEQLRPVRFRFNGKGGTSDDGTVFTGLIADEVRDVMPEMIGTLRAKLNPEDDLEVDLLTLDATSLIYALVNAVQELAAMLKEKR